ncbi:acyl dehydratase [Nordella sp. HKS 07]|uniref:MaoC family dehydratase n=1 Tax=Nordella sp. HKS 07 TaxID=2712222 RepID=UPI0013E1ED1E|nr:MaoC/PaaZ C-terminal domain-containing protein [Nordella sp. HKS 07]QIG50489.1 acyl dehydratase [Nordella sp. HKS 07]
MTGRLLPPGRYFYEDIDTGDVIETAALTVTTDHIDRFADLTGDRFEIHMSEEGAARHGFPKRVAHGLLILSLVDGLKNQTEAQFAAVASLGWEWKFAAPVLPGDAIKARMTVTAKRETKRADRGILTIAFDVVNQDAKTVQSGINTLMVLRSHS